MRRTSFQEDLDRLKQTCRRRASSSSDRSGSLNALEQQDAELADEVIAFDDEVDARYLEISQNRAAARPRDPVAVDRLVLAVLHINLGLERMADLCVTIAKLTKLTAELRPTRRSSRPSRRWERGAEEMTRVDALVRRARCRRRREPRRPRRADRPRQQVVKHVLELGTDPSLRNGVCG